MAQLNSGYLNQNKLKIILLQIIDFLLYIFPKQKRPFPMKINKILLIKPDHLGDMLLLTSVLPLIKKRFPGAVIDIAANKWNASIIENNPYIRKVYLVNSFKMNRDNYNFIMKILRFMNSYFKTMFELRREKYDICLIMRSYGGNLISLARLGGCLYIIGHKTGGLGALLDLAVEWEPGIHETGHFLEVLKPLGITSETKELIYEIYPALKSVEKIDRFMKDNFRTDEKIAFIHPGAGDMRKSLTLENWKSIIALIEKKGFSIVITGSTGEKDIAQKIAPSGAKIFCGIFTIQELALFFKKAALLVTVDSLSAHLAVWSGTKTAVFFSGINNKKQWEPLGIETPRNNVILIDRECKKAPCFKGCGRMECLEADLMEFDKFISQ